MTQEDMMEAQILGKRKELDKFLAFASANADRFSTIETFTAWGKPTNDPSRISYTVGTVDRPALMRAYVQHVFQERQANAIPVLTQVA